MALRDSPWTILSCNSIIRTASGQVAQINGLLQNIASIETDGIDFTVNYRSPPTGAGTFGLFWASTYLFNYTVVVPATVGVTVIEREGTEQGSPDQAFPEVQVDRDPRLDAGQFRRLADRPLHRRGRGRQRQPAGLDLLYRYPVPVTVDFWMERHLEFAIGANNLFGVDPPDCISCGLNNFDPTTYDVPGTYFYGRIRVAM